MEGIREMFNLGNQLEGQARPKVIGLADFCRWGRLLGMWCVLPFWGEVNAFSG